MDQPPAVAFTSFADVWPRATEMEIGAVLCAIGAGKDFDFDKWAWPSRHTFLKTALNYLTSQVATTCQKMSNVMHLTRHGFILIAIKGMKRRYLKRR